MLPWQHPFRQDIAHVLVPPPEHEPALQVPPVAVQLWQAAPPVPQLPFDVPVRHVPVLVQHPGQ